MSQWHLQNGETYLVTGEPVIVSDVTSSISHSIELLLIAVLLVMGLVLSLIFKGRPRLLPLAIALLAAALTFGALALSGASLTMASVAVLPVLVGLSVDYAIQFQSRVEEARAEGACDTLEAIRRAALHGVPTIATAVLASIGGLLVLTLSPVPMVRGFGLLLVLRRRDRVPLRFDGRLGRAGASPLVELQRISGNAFAGVRVGGTGRAGKVRVASASACCSRSAHAIFAACWPRLGRARARSSPTTPPAASSRTWRSTALCATRAACSGSASCWPRSDGGWTPRPKCKPTSPSSPRRISPRFTTWTNSSA